MSATVTWSAIIGGCDDPCVVRRTSRLLSVFGPEPQDAAATALRFWLEDSEPGSWTSNWDVEIGADESEATAVVVIHEPADMTGCYEVTLQRVIEARGYQAEPDEQARAMRILSATTSP